MFGLNIYLKRVRKEISTRNKEREVFWAEALQRVKEDGVCYGSLKDYRRMLYKHRFSYDEYVRYRLWALSKRERDNIISCSEMNSIYRKFLDTSVRRIFADKPATLQKFEKYVQRRWLRAKDASYEDFCKLVSTSDCIVKPCGGDCGQGIFKTNKEDTQDLKSLYDKCARQDMIVEECVTACDEIARFHPASLNTLRIITMQNASDFVILGASLRMGAGGSVIDNISAGGISVLVDEKTGEIIMNGYDAKGNEYEKHPTTGEVFKGSVIPYWNNVLDMLKEACHIVPRAFFIGWDLCILPSGEIELIEANALPNLRPTQYAPLYGKKELVRESSERLLNLNLLTLIPVWSRYHRRFD